jgi:hypothetical protein
MGTNKGKNMPRRPKNTGNGIPIGPLCCGFPAPAQGEPAAICHLLRQRNTLKKRISRLFARKSRQWCIALFRQAD